ncbi:hypothetical protein AJ79_09582 [Helicocarpus griseus UAMH5409]|uniref:Probable E3 ubiquitin ligase complex SCF subunit sconB n=1 Tax=Helicocarpus griseus UAMH5409 TaxID=1447875 RepID=A0A2B7WIY0_9EURO|nr:hypothetical protein AJ79_09582 [Helicocarpus griseus UAMH5409]
MEHDSAPAAGAGHTPRPQVGKSPSKYASPPVVATFKKLDEGYSDETRGQAENEVIQTDEGLILPNWLLAHSEEDRAELAYTILRTLPTSTIAAVVDRLTPFLYMDPVLKLPPEITAEIFSYLDPSTLLTATLASKTWRERILDSRLWRHLYIQEGWGFDIDAVRNFDQTLPKSHLSNNKGKSKAVNSDKDRGHPELKRRVPAGWIDSRHDSRGEPGMMQDVSPPWNEQHDMVEADGTPPSDVNSFPDAEGDHEMRDASYDDYPRKPSTDEIWSLQSTGRRGSAHIQQPRKFPHQLTTDYKLRITPSLFTVEANGTRRLNWTYLYKQRRILEDNWNKGHFVNFQLPHPSHPEEGHTECVYTMQFSSKWLVSGSRDMTVRVWDLETRRLRGEPLIGHTKSVLCLQFDSSAEEDVIISGSGDQSVIVWRFSTGERIHEIANAHEDSVLNLRFDKRYLVTCSKDRLIKVWNRRGLSPMDKDYPKYFNGSGVQYPSYIIDTSMVSPSMLEAQLANGQIQSLEPYSLLMTLEGHGAAVNAIQIYQDEIVSASGDRLLKVWDIRSGACLKTFIGHKKGIACVQFDSRRIVSGSNDNTVRIYDHASGAEVACLHGHDGLVRTVQAGFGDPPGAEETLRLEAMAVDTQYWEAQLRGDIPEPSRRHRRIPHEGCAGSRHPKDIMALGAKIPPGGGGSIWGRIVSGSYDETIIIWKKDHEGKWVIGQRLRQEEAGRAAAATDEEDPSNPLTDQTTTANNPDQAHQLSTTPQPGPQSPHQNASGSSTVQPNTSDHSMLNSTGTPNDAGSAYVNAISHQHPQPPQGRHALHPQALQQGQAPQQARAHQQARAIQQGQAAIAGPNGLVLPAQPQPTARVFKLQFDARQLICASLDHRIIGWDFADGDEELEWACQFFTGL